MKCSTPGCEGTVEDVPKELTYKSPEQIFGYIDPNTLFSTLSEAPTICAQCYNLYGRINAKEW